MALDDLRVTIEKLQDKIRTHRPYLSGKETATRQVLIDPLLLALGWDVSDPAQIELEYPVGDGRRADYALVSNDQPVAVIEAKRLGTALEEEETRQVLTYANSRGIAYMVVTNGDDWRMYDVFARQPIEERILMQFSITQTPAHESALQALRIWRSNLASSGNPMPAKEPVLQSGEKEQPPESDEKEEQTPPQPATGSDTESGWIPLIELSGRNKNSPRPKWIKFPDGSTEQFRPSAIGVLRETAKWLANSGKLTPENARLQHPKHQNLCVSSNAKDGIRKPEEICADVYIEKDWEAQDSIDGAKALLKHCGEDPSKVHVRLNR